MATLSYDLYDSDLYKSTLIKLSYVLNEEASWCQSAKLAHLTGSKEKKWYYQ